MSRNKTRIGVLTAAAVATAAAVLVPGLTPANAGPGTTGFAKAGLYLPAVPLPSDTPSGEIKLCPSNDPARSHDCKRVPVGPGTIRSLELLIEYTSTGGTPDVVSAAGSPLPGDPATSNCGGETGALLQVVTQASSRAGSIKLLKNGVVMAQQTVDPVNGGQSTFDPAFCY